MPLLLSVNFHHQPDAQAYPFSESCFTLIHHHLQKRILNGVHQFFLILGYSSKDFLLKLRQPVMIIMYGHQL